MNKTDQKIIKGISIGNKQIIEAFYKRNFTHIQRYVLLNSGNLFDAEDVFQDALLLIYQKITTDTLVLSNSIHSYFYGICKNVWKNRLRRKKKIIFDTTLIENHQLTNNTIIDTIEHQEKEHLYRKHFMKLSTTNKKVLSYYFNGKSMKEIAKISGYSEGYARKKKFDAKKQLLQMISKDPLYDELSITTISNTTLQSKKKFFHSYT
ncbi:hypothetical protein GCM10022393_41990 [Aquimarina addita]|uniref:RNA polymerase sigma-70 region 2 domain-containing protein n=1 Tax=Aquimarina addita TaxID=870485 RepID=A0ABP6UY51_9FLAO